MASVRDETIKKKHCFKLKSAFSIKSKTISFYTQHIERWFVITGDLSFFPQTEKILIQKVNVLLLPIFCALVLSFLVLQHKTDLASLEPDSPKISCSLSCILSWA